MHTFPAFYPLAGRVIAIAGTGEAADAKVRLFDGSPATLRLLEGEAALSVDGYAGALLAFIASPDAAFAEAAAKAARAAHVPVNVVDRPTLCDFTTPAVIDRGEVVAAIGTGGASPMLATLLRQDIEARVPQGAGRVAALFGALQDEVRAAHPQVHRRRAFLRAALTGPAARAAQAGNMAQAATLLRERYRYKGELRAVGDILRDQIFLLSRVGFTTFALRDDQNVEDALAAFNDFSSYYQHAAGRFVEQHALPLAA